MERKKSAIRRAFHKRSCGRIQSVHRRYHAYTPWGNVAMFYRDFPCSGGLIPLGRITSGVENLAVLRGNFEANFEQAR